MKRAQEGVLQNNDDQWSTAEGHISEDLDTLKKKKKKIEKQIAKGETQLGKDWMMKFGNGGQEAAPAEEPMQSYGRYDD